MKKLFVSSVVILIMALAFSFVQAEEIDYKRLYQQAAPGVVLLFGTDDGKSGSQGTGSIIDKSGLVLTNHHVVSHGSGNKLWKTQFIYLKPANVTGKPRADLRNAYSGKVLATNPQYDLALVQIIDPPNNLTVLPLSDLSNVDIGEPTVAIGHPGAGARWSLTTGRIGASYEDYGNVQGWDVFQTETALNPGNSGGPLLDGTASIVGINTFIKRKHSSGMALTGLNYAVKSTTARKWIVSIMGQLPKASLVKPDVISPPPAPEVITRAQPPQPTAKSTTEMAPAKPAQPTQSYVEPLARAKPTQPRVEPKTELHVVLRRGQTRQVHLALPPRKEHRYTTRLASGEEYTESDIERLYRIRDEAFDELDQEVDKLEWDQEFDKLE